MRLSGEFEYDPLVKLHVVGLLLLRLVGVAVHGHEAPIIVLETTETRAKQLQTFNRSVKDE